MHRLTRTVAALASLIVVAGCGGDPGRFVPPSPAATTSGGAGAATPTVAPALSTEQAAELYLEIVRPYNEALERLERAINGGQELAELTELAGATATALEDEIEEFRAAVWPEAVRTHVDELAVASEQALEHWQDAARAQTRDGLVEAVLAAAEFDGGDAAGNIREILSLDSYDEDDY